MPSHCIGFTYVMTNPAMPGIVKVGFTSHLAEDRAKELHTTGVPVGFDVVYRAAISHANDVERRAHALLSPYRVAPNREFFRTTPAVAISAIHRATSEKAGIQAWTDPAGASLAGRGSARPDVVRGTTLPPDGLSGPHGSCGNYPGCLAGSCG